MIPRAIRLYLFLFLIFSIILYIVFAHPLSSLQTKEDEKQSPVTDPPSKIVETPEEQIQNLPENFEDSLVKSPDITDFHNQLNADIFKNMKLNRQQVQIKAAIQHSWEGYRKFAWGSDHLQPLSKQGSDWFGIGLTILDSLDTLIMAGMTEEYKQALEWIRTKLSFDIDNRVNCFETTIRALGGLLSAFHLTGDQVLRDSAQDLGERLLHCFSDSRTSVPKSDVNLKQKRASVPSWSPDSSLSEVSSMQLEMRDLSRVTKNPVFEEKSFATSKHLHQLVLDRNDPLLPMYINPNTGHLTRGTLTLGARADSYYEYLYKQYRQVPSETFLLDDWMSSIDQIRKRMWRKTPGKLGLEYIGEVFGNGDFSPKMDHLVCFLSGTLALGYYQEAIRKVPSLEMKTKFDEHLQMAEGLARTCHFMYNLTETGLSPEIGYYSMLPTEPQEFIIRPNDKHNLLRPEFVESLFFLYHITGKRVYREWGWQVFQAFEKYSKVPGGGYTTLDNVRSPTNTRPRDKMESFWIAETLKYLFLLFTDDKRIVGSLLNNYVFNTEAHLMPLHYS